MKQRSKIQSKYTNRLLLPANGLPGYEFETRDGVPCRATLIATWNNSDGRYDAELECVCQDLFSQPFSFIRSIWLGRLGHLDNYWHLIAMEKV